MAYFFTGIYADIAERKQEYWSSLAPLPTEVVLSAGEKARDENSSGYPSLSLSVTIVACFCL